MWRYVLFLLGLLEKTSRAPRFSAGFLFLCRSSVPHSSRALGSLVPRLLFLVLRALVRTPQSFVLPGVGSDFFCKLSSCNASGVSERFSPRSLSALCTDLSSSPQGSGEWSCLLKGESHVSSRDCPSLDLHLSEAPHFGCACWRARQSCVLLNARSIRKDSCLCAFAYVPVYISLYGYQLFICMYTVTVYRDRRKKSGLPQLAGGMRGSSALSSIP